MNEFSFVVVASGLDPAEPDFEDRFFEAGCDDATIAFQKGVIVLAFDRKAKNLIHAIQSAIADVRRAGAEVLRVEPDSLVSISEIAERTTYTRAAVSLWSQGKRGENFPLPVARVTSGTPLWDWYEVSRWLFEKREVPRHSVVSARLIRHVNESLRAEKHAGHREHARA